MSEEIKHNSIKKIEYIKNSIEMADLFRAEGKIFVVISIIISILFLLLFYILYIDKKIEKIKKEIKNNKKK